MQTFTMRRPAVHSSHGLVSAQNRHAAEAGAAVLRRGGNAVDAAITTALTLSVVEPWLSGVGGGGFLIRADGASGAIDTLDFGMRSAAGLDPADYPLAPGAEGNWFQWPAVKDDRNISGYASICVPGAIAGFAAALERHGTISFAEAVQPAIEHARRGLEIDWFAALCIGLESAALARDAVSAATLLDNGAAPRASGLQGQRYKPMPRKAEMLEQLAAAGPRDFYEGETARRITADLEAGGSPIRASDLAGYQAAWRAPLKGRYRDFDVALVPGLSAGPTWLAAAQRLEGAPLGAATPEAEAALLYARAIRDAYAERLTTMGHAAGASCTSHVSVVDRSGTMVALTNTLLSRFGALVMLPSVQLLMNNGMMWFDPRPGSANAIAPGARPLCNMCPVAVTPKDGTWPRAAAGASGGRRILASVYQMLAWTLDCGMDVETAAHQPRIDVSGPDGTTADCRLPAETIAALEAEGPLSIVEHSVMPINFACPNIIVVGKDGAEGCSDAASPSSAAVAAGTM